MTQKSLRGLVVEDDADVIELLVRILERKKVAAILAHTGETARAVLAASSDLDLILLDLHLPDGGGLTLVEQIRDGYPHLIRRTIIVTGFPMIARAFATEIPIVPKDELAQLREKIDEVLARDSTVA